MAARRPRTFLALILALVLAATACTDSDREGGETGAGGGGEAGESAATEFRFQPLEPGAVTVTALRQGDIAIALLFSTVGAIAANDWVVLEDDKGLQGSENIVPLVRSEAVDENAAAVLDGVSAELTTEDVTELNRRVDDDKEDPAAVARDYLEGKGLLEPESEGSGSLRVGTFNFTESQILGHMYAEALEAAGYDVTVEDNLGSREQVVFPAIASGQLDIVPEYIQSLLVHLDPDAESVSPDEGVERVEELLPEGLELLEPSEAQDQNALVVTSETAEKYGLSKVSDLRDVEETLTLGGPPECPQRPLCIPGYEEVYGLRFGA
jgi:glycine betaine/choline ABC-type transport system substrate-binding protein